MNDYTPNMVAALKTGKPANQQQDKNNPLASYFRDVASHDVLAADEEIALARAIAQREVEAWRRALSYPPVVDYVLRFAGARLESEFPDVRAVERAATAAKKSRTRADRDELEAAAGHIAPALREADTDHQTLDALVAELGALAADPEQRSETGPLGFSPRSRAFDEYRSGVAEAAQQAASIRHDFVRANLRLVVHVATKFARFGLPLPDLIQEGNMGLIKAVDRYDYKRGYRFSTYATWWIRHMVGRAVADKSRTVRVPVHVRDANQKLAKARRELFGELGRQPTDHELSDAVDMPVDKVRLVGESLHGGSDISLDEPLGNEGDRPRLDIFADPANEERSPFEDVSIRALIDQVRERMTVLTAQELDVVQRRFGLGEDEREWTLQEIAADYHLSRERIRQIQVGALDKLRKSLEEQPLRHAG